MKYLAGLVAFAATAIGMSGEAHAQHHHGHSHGHYHTYYRPVAPTHGHDAYGHMVDGNGHHVTTSGQHTGSVGLLDGNIVSNPLPHTANYPGAVVMQPGYGLPIKITNPASSTAPINYSLNGYNYVIRPGESQTLVNDRGWTIQFDRGGSFGLARYSLSPGLFEFTVAATGWDIVQQALPTAPNTAVAGNAPPSNPLPANPLPAPAAIPAPAIPVTALSPIK